MVLDADNSPTVLAASVADSVEVTELTLHRTEIYHAGRTRGEP